VEKKKKKEGLSLLPVTMDNNEPELSDEQRIELLNVALASLPVQQLLSNWEDQKTVYRKQAIDFWKAFDKEFEEFWIKIGNDVRTAFIMTAIEDLVTQVIIIFLNFPYYSRTQSLH